MRLTQFLNMPPRLHLLPKHNRCIHHIRIQSVASIFIRYYPLHACLCGGIYHAILRPLRHEVQGEYYYILTLERGTQKRGVGVGTFVDGHGGRQGRGGVGAGYDADLEGVWRFEEVGEDGAAYLAACLSCEISIRSCGEGPSLTPTIQILWMWLEWAMVGL